MSDKKTQVQKLQDKVNSLATKKVNQENKKAEREAAKALKLQIKELKKETSSPVLVATLIGLLGLGGVFLESLKSSPENTFFDNEGVDIMKTYNVTLAHKQIQLIVVGSYLVWIN